MIDLLIIFDPFILALYGMNFLAVVDKPGMNVFWLMPTFVKLI